MCQEGVPVFNCLIDPCMNAECPANEMAECVPNYCGGCGFDFYVAGRIIDCSTKQSSKCDFYLLICCFINVFVLHTAAIQMQRK